MAACGLVLLASLLGTTTGSVASIRINSQAGAWSRYGILAGDKALPVSGHLLYGENYCNSLSTYSDRPLIVIATSALCSFETKIRNASHNNVSAIILIVDSEFKDFEEISADIFYSDVLVVFLSPLQGENILELIDNSKPASTFITIEDICQPYVFNHSIHVVVCVFVISVVIMIGGSFVLWYYRDVIERKRKSVGKLQTPEECTIKATIEKIPYRMLADCNEKIIEEYHTCAVCFENYKISETISSLPCSHIFHKHCVCPWLAERRSCPLCKMDVLKHYGLPAASSEESILNIPLDDVMSYLESVSI